jgi:hypothetical protein
MGRQFALSYQVWNNLQGDYFHHKPLILIEHTQALVLQTGAIGEFVEDDGFPQNLGFRRAVGHRQLLQFRVERRRHGQGQADRFVVGSHGGVLSSMRGKGWMPIASR